MAIPLIQTAFQAFQLAPIAGAAVSAVSTSFSSLLQGAVAKTSPSASSTEDVPNLGDNLNIAEFRRRNDLLIQGLHSRVQQLLAENGIDISSGVHLQIEELDRIRVASGHSDAHQIESLLATEPELGDLLQVIAANSRLLNAAEEAKTFQQLYAMDPAAAVANAPQLFSNNAEQVFDLYLNALRSEVSFQRAIATG